MLSGYSEPKVWNKLSLAPLWLKDKFLYLINREKIFEIRGQKVMLDMDLARIYGYETKNFNRQVKNNIEKFPEDFMFQLTREEALRCKIFTLNDKGNMQGQHIKYLPYAFTEQGIYMLMTVLRGELAIKQSIAYRNLDGLMFDFRSIASKITGINLNYNYYKKLGYTDEEIKVLLEKDFDKAGTSRMLLWKHGIEFIGKAKK